MIVSSFKKQSLTILIGTFVAAGFLMTAAVPQAHAQTTTNMSRADMQELIKVLQARVLELQRLLEVRLGSRALKEGDEIRATSNLYVRTGASASAGVRAVVRTGTEGVIVDGPEYADGYTWWRVEYELEDAPDVTGWSAGAWLQKTVQQDRDEEDEDEEDDERDKGKDNRGGRGADDEEDEDEEEEDEEDEDPVTPPVDDPAERAEAIKQEASQRQLFSIAPASSDQVHARSFSLTDAGLMIGTGKATDPVTTGTLYTSNSLHTVRAQGMAKPIRIENVDGSRAIVSELPADVSTSLAPGYTSSRSEAFVNNANEYVQHGKRYYLKYDIYIDESSDLEKGTANDWRLVQQIVQTNQVGSSPVLSLNLDRTNVLQVTARSLEDSYQRIASFPAEKGRWHRFEYVFTLGNEGELYVWHDGELAYANSDIMLTQCDTDCGGTVKIGIYRRFSGEMGYNKIAYKDIVLAGGQGRVLGVSISSEIEELLARLAEQLRTFRETTSR